MSIWYGVLWILSALLACWSFSLLVRLVSEAVARRRKRLVSQRSNRAFWLGMLLMVVSAAVSVFGASMALYIEREYANGSRWVSAVGLVGGALGVFAVCLFIWAVVGDHSRGRVRCPRCWYDMSEATGLRCPECGHEAKNEKQFKRARRPRWAFMLAGVLMLMGVVGIWLNNRVQDRGYLAIMPDWMMLMGWESFPDDWVYEVGKNPQQASLIERIGDRLISRDASHELAEELFERMLVDQDERWSPKNRAILLAVFQADNYTRYRQHQNFDETWVPTDDKLDRLLVACADDILNAIKSKSPSAIETRILSKQSRWFYNDIYEVCAAWVTRASEGEPRYIRYGQHYFYISQSARGLLGGLEVGPGEIDLIQFIRDDDQQRLARLIQLLSDSGGMGLYIDQFIEAGLSLHGNQRADVLLCHAIAILMLSENRRIEELRTVAGMVREGDLAERMYGLNLMVPLSRVSLERDEAVGEARMNLVLAAYERAVMLRDGEFSTGARGQLDAAIEAVTAYDESGRYSFRIVSESLENNGVEPVQMDRRRFYSYENTDERIHQWIEHFEKFAGSSNPYVRMWIVTNCPERVGTPDDERIDAMLQRLVADADVEVAGEAYDLQAKRRQ